MTVDLRPNGSDEQSVTTKSDEGMRTIMATTKETTKEKVNEIFHRSSEITSNR
jgi:hypothetical protein